MKTQHTPGPWAISGVGHSIGIAPDDGNSDGIAHVFGCGPQDQADAELVSAAPDLLNALESLAVWNNGNPCFCHVHGESERATYSKHDSYCDKAQAAIAKAKGIMP
jgi:hypothetical protein